MKIFALLLLVALPVGAQLVTRPLTVECADKEGMSICVIPERELDYLLTNNNEAMRMFLAAVERIKELEAKKPPKCAEVEITEPSKNAPPPKKLPPIPRERDS